MSCPYLFQRKTYAMRKMMSLAALFWLVLAGAASAQPAPPAAAPAPVPTQGRKKRVAIFDFDYATVHSGVAALFGQDVDVGKGISDLLVTYLVKDGSYSVIERKAMDKILAEQKFQQRPRQPQLRRQDWKNAGRGRDHRWQRYTIRQRDQKHEHWWRGRRFGRLWFRRVRTQEVQSHRGTDDAHRGH